MKIASVLASSACGGKWARSYVTSQGGPVMQLSMITLPTPLTGNIRGEVGLSTLLAINSRPRGGALAHA